ncbi:unnamed protein product, partial [Polarella glacialis]
MLLQSNWSAIYQLFYERFGVEGLGRLTQGYAVKASVEMTLSIVSKCFALLRSDPHGRLHCTPLHIAALQSSTEAAEVIVRDRPQVVQEAHQNSSTALCPLHIAILCGSYAIVELLLDGGANVNVRTLHDVTPLHLAATTSKELCMLLVSYAADLSQRDVMGTTAVHYAAAFKQREALEMLLGSAGGQAQRLAGEGDQKRVTPLHISCALYSGREDLVAPMLILAAGAKPWQADVSGATALDVVPWSQDSELQRFFERCGDGAKPAAQAWLEEHYAYRGKVAGSREANEDLWEEGETPLVSQTSFSVKRSDWWENQLKDPPITGSVLVPVLVVSPILRVWGFQLLATSARVICTLRSPPAGPLLRLPLAVTEPSRLPPRQEPSKLLFHQSPLLLRACPAPQSAIDPWVARLAAVVAAGEFAKQLLDGGSPSWRAKHPAYLGGRRSVIHVVLQRQPGPEIFADDSNTAEGRRLWTGQLCSDSAVFHSFPNLREAQTCYTEAVFVGEIPVRTAASIRSAISAFKVDEEAPDFGMKDAITDLPDATPRIPLEARGARVTARATPLPGVLLLLDLVEEIFPAFGLVADLADVRRRLKPSAFRGVDSKIDRSLLPFTGDLIRFANVWIMQNEEGWGSEFASANEGGAGLPVLQDDAGLDSAEGFPTSLPPLGPTPAPDGQTSQSGRPTSGFHDAEQVAGTAASQPKAQVQNGDQPLAKLELSADQMRKVSELVSAASAADKAIKACAQAHSIAVADVDFKDIYNSEGGVEGWAAQVEDARTAGEEDPSLLTVSAPDRTADSHGKAGPLAGSGIGGARGVAARRLLVERLKTHPEDYFIPVEARMQELTAEDDRITYPLDYVKTTSMMGSHKSTVMWMFLLAPIHTALVKGDRARARALTALSIMAGEQMTLDEGSWILAWQMTMLPEPPVAIVAARRYAAYSINPHSPVAEQRWVEAQLAYLKNADTIIDRHKKAPAIKPKGKGKGEPAAPGPSAFHYNSLITTLPVELRKVSGFFWTVFSRLPTDAAISPARLVGSSVRPILPPNDLSGKMPGSLGGHARSRWKDKRSVDTHVNLTVAILSWHALGRLAACPDSARFGKQLSTEQCQVVKRLRGPILEASRVASVAVADLGKQALRLEPFVEIEVSLSAMFAQLSEIGEEFSAYRAKSSRSAPCVQKDFPSSGKLVLPEFQLSGAVTGAIDAARIAAKEVRLPVRSKPLWLTEAEAGNLQLLQAKCEDVKDNLPILSGPRAEVLSSLEVFCGSAGSARAMAKMKMGNSLWCTVLELHVLCLWCQLEVAAPGYCLTATDYGKVCTLLCILPCRAAKQRSRSSVSFAARSTWNGSHDHVPVQAAMKASYEKSPELEIGFSSEELPREDSKKKSDRCGQCLRLSEHSRFTRIGQWPMPVLPRRWSILRNEGQPSSDEDEEEEGSDESEALRNENIGKNEPAGGGNAQMMQMMGSDGSDSGSHSDLGAVDGQPWTIKERLNQQPWGKHKGLYRDEAWLLFGLPGPVGHMNSAEYAEEMGAIRAYSMALRELKTRTGRPATLSSDEGASLNGAAPRLISPYSRFWCVSADKYPRRASHPLIAVALRRSSGLKGGLTRSLPLILFLGLGCPVCEDRYELAGGYRHDAGVTCSAKALLAGVRAVAPSEAVLFGKALSGGKQAIEEALKKFDKYGGHEKKPFADLEESARTALPVVLSRAAAPANAGQVNPADFLCPERRAVFNDLAKLKLEPHLLPNLSPVACLRVSLKDEDAIARLLLNSILAVLVEESQMPRCRDGKLLLSAFWVTKESALKDRLIYGRRSLTSSVKRLDWAKLPSASKHLCLCLRVLRMGDSNACDIAQACRVGIPRRHFWKLVQLGLRRERCILKVLQKLMGYFVFAFTTGRALGKGRSSSSQLNGIIRGMLGYLITTETALRVVWVGNQVQPGRGRTFAAARFLQPPRALQQKSVDLNMHGPYDLKYGEGRPLRPSNNLEGNEAIPEIATGNKFWRRATPRSSHDLRSLATSPKYQAQLAEALGEFQCYLGIHYKSWKKFKQLRLRGQLNNVWEAFASWKFTSRALLQLLQCGLSPAGLGPVPGERLLSLLSLPTSAASNRVKAPTQSAGIVGAVPAEEAEPQRSSSLPLQRAPPGFSLNEWNRKVLGEGPFSDQRFDRLRETFDIFSKVRNTEDQSHHQLIAVTEIVAYVPGAQSKFMLPVLVFLPFPCLELEPLVQERGAFDERLVQVSVSLPQLLQQLLEFQQRESWSVGVSGTGGPDPSQPEPQVNLVSGALPAVVAQAPVSMEQPLAAERQELQTSQPEVSQVVSPQPDSLGPAPEEALSTLSAADRQLLEGAHEHDFAKVKLALQQGADVQCQEGAPYFRSALHLSVERGGSLELMDALLEAKADIHSVMASGRTPLHVAIQQYANVSPTILRMLLCSNADLNIKDT